MVTLSVSTGFVAATMKIMHPGVLVLGGFDEDTNFIWSAEVLLPPPSTPLLFLLPSSSPPPSPPPPLTLLDLLSPPHLLQGVPPLAMLGALPGRGQD